MKIRRSCKFQQQRPSEIPKALRLANSQVGEHQVRTIENAVTGEACDFYGGPRTTTIVDIRRTFMQQSQSIDRPRCHPRG
jgi:hypothetical protein